MEAPYAVVVRFKADVLMAEWLSDGEPIGLEVNLAVTVEPSHLERSRILGLGVRLG